MDTTTRQLEESHEGLSGNENRSPDDATASNGAANQGFARDLLEALVRFRNGDFGSAMRSDLVGLEGKIADVFNDILSVSARRTAETARVCHVVGEESSKSACVSPEPSAAGRTRPTHSTR
jgi:hypothetical protein